MNPFTGFEDMATTGLPFKGMADAGYLTPSGTMAESPRSLDSRHIEENKDNNKNAANAAWTIRGIADGHRAREVVQQRQGIWFRQA